MDNRGGGWVGRGSAEGVTYFPIYFVFSLYKPFFLSQPAFDIELINYVSV